MKTDTVKHIATLSNIPITDEEATKIQHAFDETLQTISNLEQLDITSVESTHQVTGLENVLREDTVHSERSFTQEEALANAKQTHNGYFVVPRIIED